MHNNRQAEEAFTASSFSFLFVCVRLFIQGTFNNIAQGNFSPECKINIL